MSTEAIKTRTYGNWRRPRKAGLGSFGLVGTVGVFGGLIGRLHCASVPDVRAADRRFRGSGSVFAQDRSTVIRK